MKSLIITALFSASIAPAAFGRNAAEYLRTVAAFSNDAAIQAQAEGANGFVKALELSSFDANRQCGFAGCEYAQTTLVVLPVDNSPADGRVEPVAALVTTTWSTYGQEKASTVKPIAADALAALSDAAADEQLPAMQGLGAKEAALKAFAASTKALEAKKALTVTGAKKRSVAEAVTIGGGCGFAGCDSVYFVTELYDSGAHLSTNSQATVRLTATVRVSNLGTSVKIIDAETLAKAFSDTTTEQ